jgi:UDPglucose 6-dehydrogenase
MKKIGIIGLGKLGLDCAEVFAQHYKTYGYDIYDRVSNSVHIVPTPQQLIDICDWIFIAVPTPHDPGYDGSVPSSHLEPRDFGHESVITALNYVRDHAKTAKKVVLISTVLPGTTRRRLVQELGNSHPHQLFYNPYLIAMGSVKWDMVNPEMVIIGTDQADSGLANQLIDLYRPMMANDPRYVTGTWEECESIKIFYNTFISAKIGLVNMIQDFAQKIGNINVDVVTDALANSNIRIMSPKYMTAGMGDSGACVLPSFPVTVNGQVIAIKDLYESFDNTTYLIESANYAITARDEKKIEKVTCREYAGDIIRFVENDMVLLECTPDHLIPVLRNNKRIIMRADEITEKDKLFRLF